MVVDGLGKEGSASQEYMSAITTLRRRGRQMDHLPPQCHALPDQQVARHFCERCLDLRPAHANTGSRTSSRVNDSKHAVTTEVLQHGNGTALILSHFGSSASK